MRGPNSSGQLSLEPPSAVMKFATRTPDLGCLAGHSYKYLARAFSLCFLVFSFFIKLQSEKHTDTFTQSRRHYTDQHSSTIIRNLQSSQKFARMTGESSQLPRTPEGCPGGPFLRKLEAGQECRWCTDEAWREEQITLKLQDRGWFGFAAENHPDPAAYRNSIGEVLSGLYHIWGTIEPSEWDFNLLPALQKRQPTQP